MLMAVTLPAMGGVLEQGVTAQAEVRTTANSIVVHADARTVWQHLKTVPAIRAGEFTPGWSNRVGFPKPMAATLDREGV